MDIGSNHFLIPTVLEDLYRTKAYTDLEFHIYGSSTVNTNYEEERDKGNSSRDYNNSVGSLVRDYDIIDSTETVEIQKEHINMDKDGHSLQVSSIQKSESSKNSKPNSKINIDQNGRHEDSHDCVALNNDGSYNSSETIQSKLNREESRKGTAGVSSSDNINNSTKPNPNTFTDTTLSDHNEESGECVTSSGNDKDFPKLNSSTSNSADSPKSHSASIPSTSSTSDIITGGDVPRIIKVHRIVVCSQCSWFDRALSSGMKESIDRQVCLF